MTHRITVQPSGHEFTAEPGQTILDAALAAGVALPYSCRDGACSTCKGKVVSGDIHQGPHQPASLTADEARAGYALFCCATPKSDLVLDARVVQGVEGIEVRKIPVRIQHLEPLAPDVMLVRLQLPAKQHIAYKAGQYLEFVLRNGARRSYSMATPPHIQGTVELHVRHMPGGIFTDGLFGATEPPVKVRDIMRCEMPLGSFFLREESSKPVILLASGTGFAPVKAMVEHMQHAGIERELHFYWGGRRPHDLYLHSLAEEWQNSIPQFHYVPVVSDALPEDNWQGRTGFVHEAVMQDFADLSGHQVYACGNPAMVNAARHDFAERCGLPTEEFYADAFTSAADTAQLVE